MESKKLEKAVVLHHVPSWRRNGVLILAIVLCLSMLSNIVVCTLGSMANESAGSLSQRVDKLEEKLQAVESRTDRNRGNIGLTDVELMPGCLAGGDWPIHGSCGDDSVGLFLFERCLAKPRYLEFPTICRD